MVIPFDEDFSKKTAEEFVDEVLVERLGADARVGGGELPLRQGAQGTPALLPSASEFETRVVPLVEVKGETVSSSHIRGPGGGGRGEGGRGLPRRRRSCSRARWCTATSAGASSASRPPTSCRTTGCGARATASTRRWAHGHPAAVNVGVRPTFDTGRGLLVEAYLLDFDGDLYGDDLRVAFLERLRGEKRFESVGRAGGADAAGRAAGASRDLCSATVFRR